MSGCYLSSSCFQAVLFIEAMAIQALRDHHRAEPELPWLRLLLHGCCKSRERRPLFPACRDASNVLRRLSLRVPDGRSFPASIVSSFPPCCWSHRAAARWYDHLLRFPRLTLEQLHAVLPHHLLVSKSLAANEPTQPQDLLGEASAESIRIQHVEPPWIGASMLPENGRPVGICCPCFDTGQFARGFARLQVFLTKAAEFLLQTAHLIPQRLHHHLHSSRIWALPLGRALSAIFSESLLKFKAFIVTSQSLAASLTCFALLLPASPHFRPQLSSKLLHMHRYCAPESWRVYQNSKANSPHRWGRTTEGLSLSSSTSRVRNSTCRLCFVSSRSRKTATSQPGTAQEPHGCCAHESSKSCRFRPVNVR